MRSVIRQPISPARRAERGMTLVELMLVMLILAVVTALAAPSLSRFSSSRSLKEEARRFVALTAYARSEAISQSTPMALWLDPETRSFGLRPVDGYASAATAPIDWTLGEGLQLAVTAGSEATGTAGAFGSVRFAGGAADDAATIHFGPDGALEESSPIRLELRSDRGGTIVIVRAADRAGYVIESGEAAPR